ncbi:MAG: HEPN domain-containing protein [Actinobacteria bacterium]|nr:HEPN domain-containing protein [Actinomycetota bacterium]MBU1944004.1 HEPN domain-containing protein [Actinomycetota bacterium]MBU2688500.1 HEPN domain-containing protein [Actinomycetota bacterium]
MPPEDAGASEAREWLSKARGDLRAAEHGATAQPPITGDMVFHAQQVVEKSLKAFLSRHEVPFRKTHNLVELGEQSARLEPDLEPLLRKAAYLTEYSWRFRYPGDAEEPDIDEAREAVDLAAEVLEAILDRIPEPRS